MGRQCSLRGDGGGDSIGDAGKDGKAAIAFATRPHNLSVVPGDELLDQLVMSHQRLADGSRMLLPDGSTAFEVGQEVGDGAGR